MATIAYNGIIYGNNTVELTKTEYDALSGVVLIDGKTYFITDVEADIDSLRYKTAIITLLANGFETGKIQTVLVDEVTSNSIVIISPKPKLLKTYSEDGCYCSE